MEIITVMRRFTFLLCNSQRAMKAFDEFNCHQNKHNWGYTQEFDTFNYGI